MAVSVVGDSTTASGNTSPIAWTHTTTGATNLLVVTIAWRGAISITGVTYDGIALTHLYTQVNNVTTGNNMRSSAIYYLVNPGTRTANISVSHGGNRVVTSAINFSGVDTFSPFGSAVALNETGGVTNPSVTVSSATGDLVVDTIAVSDSSSITVESGQTELTQLFDTNCRNATSVKNGASSVSMSWATANSGSIGKTLIGVTVRAAAEGGGGEPITVSPFAGGILASGSVPSVAQARSVSPAAGTVQATGYAPTVAQEAARTVSPASGHVSLLGYAPGIAQGAARTVSPVIGRVSVSGSAPGVSQGAETALSPGAGHVSVLGHAPTVAQGMERSVSPAAGTVQATGYAPTVAQDSGQRVNPSTARVTTAGYAPTVEKSTVIAPTTGAARLAGNAPIIVQGVTVSPFAGHTVAAGYTPSVTQEAVITVSPTAGRMRARGNTPFIMQFRPVFSLRRTLTIDAENRALPVAPENRALLVQ